MIRLSLIVTCLAISLMSIGCCGPIACGTGCGVPMGCDSCDVSMGCDSCSGTVVRGGVIHSPLDGLRRMKRNITCGSGCGEVYRGEWRSTPPDCEDPCCGSQWVGGARTARPFCFDRLCCWQPGMLLGKLYGGRFCSGAESCLPCGCGDVCHGGCGASFDGGMVDGEIISAAGSGCGCASCDSSTQIGSGIRMATGIPASDQMTRSASMRHMDAQVNRIRR